MKKGKSKKINKYYSQDNVLKVIYCLWDRVKGADFETFEIIKDRYAKDKKNIYINGIIIEWADSYTFEVIDEWFSRDKKSVYNFFFQMDWVDSSTFELIQDSCYGKDKKFVYELWHPFERSDDDEDIFHEIIERADPSTFEIVDMWYSKDKNFVFDSDGKIMDWVNPENFIHLPSDYMRHPDK